jgi:hypothetical protein
MTAFAHADRSAPKPRRRNKNHGSDKIQLIRFLVDNNLATGNLYPRLRTASRKREKCIFRDSDSWALRIASLYRIAAGVGSCWQNSGNQYIL